VLLHALGRRRPCCPANGAGSARDTPNMAHVQSTKRGAGAHAINECYGEALTMN